MSSTAAYRALSSVRYVYLAIFFLLLSGLFQPLIFGNEGDKLVAGFFILLLGLSGGVMLWRSAHHDSNRIPAMALGFGLIGASLYLIFLMASN